jgi:hypothetical protein
MFFFKFLGSLSMKKAGQRPFKLYLGFKMDGSALKSHSVNDLV